MPGRNAGRFPVSILTKRGLVCLHPNASGSIAFRILAGVLVGLPSNFLGSFTFALLFGNLALRILRHNGARIRLGLEHLTVVPSCGSAALRLPRLGGLCHEIADCCFAVEPFRSLV